MEHRDTRHHQAGTHAAPPAKPFQSHLESLSPEIPESGNQWKLFDLLKISTGLLKKKKEVGEPVKPVLATVAANCACCGTVVSYPQAAEKFKCSVCHTTIILQDHITYFGPCTNIPHVLSLKYVAKVIDKCLTEASAATSSTSVPGRSLHTIFEPLSTYLYNAFKSYHCMVNSFKVKRLSTKLHYSTSNINYEEVNIMFNMLTRLPTKRPLFSALQGSLVLLKRIPNSFGEDARSYSWLLILLEIPFLAHSLTHYETNDDGSSTVIDAKEVKALSYEILKRVLGILSNINSVTVKNYIISWISKYTGENFVSKVDLINIYITFHLKKYFYIANNPDYRRRIQHILLKNPNHVSGSTGLDQEYFDNSQFKEEIEQMNLVSPTALPLGGMNFGRSKSKKSKDGSCKIRIFQYGTDWHLTSASTVLQYFIEANNLRTSTTNFSNFYNSLVDYVNLKIDFDSWVSNQKFKEQKPNDTPEILLVLDYINGSSSTTYGNSATFFFCKFPFLIALGNKISILEYEAKRVMERKAEEAFINSLDKRIPIDVYFRVKVRRSHIIQDSLKCINNNQHNLKKSLKVQFIGEAGIDAGGLRKEWFLLLTKSMFNLQTGILVFIEESNFHWFNLVPIDNLEIYYLFGAILGLAIYNSTILDLNFPAAFYKLLLHEPLGFSDFQELYPLISNNLFKLKELEPNELIEMELTFEITLTDLFGRTKTKELIPNGRKIKVNANNRDIYIEKYAKFHLIEGIPLQIDMFLQGFNSVTRGNALSLFSAKEIELLLCGNEEGKLDIDVFRSITKYLGWQGNNNKNDYANHCDVVNWFWEYLNDQTYTNQKKFLTFVSGSDRIPATGIQNLNFTIRRVGKDSDRLPVAHTCFNELELYEYATKEKLYNKLDLAINGSSGFGIK